MNTPVGFELSKLLKDKGYGNTAPWKLGRDYYNHLGELNGDVTDYIRAFVKLKDRKDRSELTHLETIDAPTIAEVVMWLHNQHNLWINIEIVGDENIYPKYRYQIIDLTKWNSGLEYQIKLLEIPYEELIASSFDTPTQAYEAAIIHVFKNFLT
jgi:hypothetical protein